MGNDEPSFASVADGDNSDGSELLKDFHDCYHEPADLLPVTPCSSKNSDGGKSKACTSSDEDSDARSRVSSIGSGRTSVRREAKRKRQQSGSRAAGDLPALHVQEVVTPKNRKEPRPTPRQPLEAVAAPLAPAPSGRARASSEIGTDTLPALRGDAATDRNRGAFLQARDVERPTSMDDEDDLIAQFMDDFGDDDDKEEDRGSLGGLTEEELNALLAPADGGEQQQEEQRSSGELGQPVQAPAPVLFPALEGRGLGTAAPAAAADGDSSDDADVITTGRPCWRSSRASRKSRRLPTELFSFDNMAAAVAALPEPGAAAAPADMSDEDGDDEDEFGGMRYGCEMGR